MDQKQGMNRFFTRQKSNEGVVIKLNYPDGTPSDEWIRIRGQQSDIFRRADNECRRKMMAAALLPENTEEEKASREEAFQDAQRKLIASLVMDWSFPDECNEENVLSLLREAPDIMDRLDTESGKRRNFFGACSTDSPSMPSTNSNSTDEQPPSPVSPSETP